MRLKKVSIINILSNRKYRVAYTDILNNFNIDLYKILNSKFYSINNAYIIKNKDTFYINLTKDNINLYKIIKQIKKTTKTDICNIKVNYKNSVVLSNVFYNKHYKTMYMYIDDYKYYENNLEKIFIKNLNVTENIDLRIYLQNSIFNSSDSKRKPVDKTYIYREINHNSFLPNYCYVLFFDDIPIGYAQIIKEKNKFYLVNFGIIQGYRENGYGKSFIKLILNDIKQKGEIKQLFLNVDNDNTAAINLYYSVGFISLINILETRI